MAIKRITAGELVRGDVFYLGMGRTNAKVVSAEHHGDMIAVTFSRGAGGVGLPERTDQTRNLAVGLVLRVTEIGRASCRERVLVTV